VPTSKLETQIELLHDISKALTQNLNVKESLQEVLALLEQHMKMKRGAISLLDLEENILSTEVAHGISPEDIKKGRYRVGEGITGKVVKTGETEIVPRVSQDPRFLNRMGIRSNQDISFICVPLKSEGKAIGALSVDIEYQSEVTFREEVRLLNIVASMLGQHLHLYNLHEEAQEQLLRENVQLRNELRHRYSVSNLVGSSKSMKEVFDLVMQVAPTNTNVLIRGETGTGKELVAHAIHYNSHRADQPFVKVNCAAFPETLLESELFGHEKGAFTGASAQKQGRFEWAHNGTLFLDEIGEIPLSIQIKLLRAIQFKEFERVGGKETIKVNVRIIAATNKNLEQALKDGSLREDMYYRINVFPIFLPPLRERKTDIITLADHFLLKYSEENNKTIRRISTPAIDLLMSYHWPGNVRELENCIERAVVLCNESVIRVNHLPPSLQMASQGQEQPAPARLTMPVAVENLEREMIIETLKKHQGHQGHAAADLGITERILGYKIKKYSIVPKIYSSTMQKYTNL
jgi:Nif-specific regulatory protein